MKMFENYPLGVDNFSRTYGLWKFCRKPVALIVDNMIGNTEWRTIWYASGRITYCLQNKATFSHPKHYERWRTGEGINREKNRILLELWDWVSIIPELYTSRASTKTTRFINFILSNQIFCLFNLSDRQFYLLVNVQPLSEIVTMISDLSIQNLFSERVDLLYRVYQKIRKKFTVGNIP